MAKASGLSASTVQRVWRAFGLMTFLVNRTAGTGLVDPAAAPPLACCGTRNMRTADRSARPSVATKPSATMPSRPAKAKKCHIVSA